MSFCHIAGHFFMTHKSFVVYNPLVARKEVIGVSKSNRSGTAQQKTIVFYCEQNKKHQQVIPQRKLSSGAYAAR